MSISVTIPESRWSPVPLTDDQADALERTGERLASSAEWWGAGEQTDGATSLVRCRRTRNNKWLVRVSDAVGVIAVEDLEIVIQPKIELYHFLHLLQLAELLPRHGETPAIVQEAPDLWRLVALWFVAELERVLRLGLVPDYIKDTNELPFARGSIQPRETVRSFYSGRPVLTCTYEGFGLDTAHNRALRAAAQVIVSSPSLNWELRRRARVTSELLADIGELLPGDLLAAITSRDRRLGHYQPALQLAEHVLRRAGRTLVGGHQTVWTFLIRTPGVAEDAIRKLLRREFGRDVADTSSRTFAGVSFNPDIWFPGRATADVKYKLAGEYWDRSALYQAISFATAFEVPRAAVFDFSESPATLPEATPGGIAVRHIPWRLEETPAAAASRFVSDVESWLTSAGSEAGGKSGR